MGVFTDLWLPIVVSAVLVFVASSILHMLIPIHKGDYRKLPDESELLTAMRTRGVMPGAYSFPFPASMKDLASPEMIARYQQGPVGLLTVLPNGVPAMGKLLGLWMLYCVVQSVFVAYLAVLALSWGATGVEVLRVTSTAALLGYGVPHLHDAIWKGQSWITTGKYMLDGVIYSLVTGGTFVLLWPAVP
jgi:hypothetical protein